MNGIIYLVIMMLGTVLAWWGGSKAWEEFMPKPLESAGLGGNGGHAIVTGANSIAIGGQGGSGGASGKGGDGGGAESHADNSFAVGGEGGRAGKNDGSTGEGGRSAFELLEHPNELLPDGSWLWDKGKGGDGVPAGGGAGGYVKAVILNPASSYQFSVGKGGRGAPGAKAGGDGVIIVTEYYQ